MMPTDCYMPAPPKVVESVCMTTGGVVMDETIPMPEDALVIVSQLGGESVDFTVTQKWTTDDAGLAIEAGMNSCIIKGNVTFGDSEEIQGECVEGYAGVTVVVYMDEEFEPDECEACNVDDLSEMGGEYEFCAYRIELPCDPISVECGEPSASPSEGPTSFPTSSPSGSPSGSPSESPSDSPSGSPSSAPTGGPSASPSAGPSVSPSTNPTAYPTESMMPTDCYMPAPPKVIESVCMTTDGDLMNKTIPMPEGALVINSQVGADMIDFTVTQKWTTDDAGLAIEAGLNSCIVKGNVTFGDSENIEGECVEGLVGVTVVVYMDAEFEPDECEACNLDDLSEMGGDYEFCAYRIELPCEPISVECGEPSSAPSGSPTDAPTTAPTGAPSAAPSSSSYPSSAPSSSPSDSFYPSSSPTENPTKGVDEIFPPPSPAPTKCPPDDPILISAEGETMYPDLPVTITMQNTTHVGFKVENTFEFTASSIFTEYHAGSFGETECLEEENVENESSVEIEFVAQCMHHTKISIINVWVTDCGEANTFLDESDNAEIPECCHPGEQCRTVQYTFKLPCVDPCPEDEVTTLPITDSPVPKPVSPPVSAPVNGGKYGRPNTYSSDPSGTRRNLKKNEGDADEFESITGHHEAANTDDHFCVVEDYPCGPDNDKVYVCHYSARDGYKTFCVPEPDSDALRFYPKDYCGPCVGGYVTSET
jgi:hypothetical protein